MDAVEDDCIHPTDRHRIAAAALRAAAEQPYEVLACFRGDDYLRFSDGVDAERNRLLAIATELETRQ
jgi:hypothetical protein